VRTALHLAAQTDASGTLVALFSDAGLDVNARDNGGRTPLMHAADGCHANNVHLLLERGAVVHARCSHAGATALHKLGTACWCGGSDRLAQYVSGSLSRVKETVQLLVAAGADTAAEMNSAERPPRGSRRH